LTRRKRNAFLFELAKRGAEHRYQELKAEIAALEKIFSHLRYGSAVSPAMPDAMEEPTVRRRRRKMSAAARAKISAAQKKRWAKVRAKGQK
jgi:hypothetical protein